MRNIFWYLIFFSFIFSINSQICDFDYENEMTGYPLSIKLTLFSSNIPYRHPIKIHYDYSTFDADEFVDDKYKSTVKKYIKEATNFLKEILIIYFPYKISTGSKIEKICSDSITLYDNKINNIGFNSDLVIYPFFDDLDRYHFVKSYICAVDSTNNRPIIAALSLNRYYQFYNDSYDELYRNSIEHQLIHLLGFNKRMYESFVHPVQDFSTIFTINTYINDYYYYSLNTPNVYSIGVKYNFGGGPELEQYRNRTNSHWYPRKNFIDLMVRKNYEYYDISEITLALFKDSGIYYINPCGFYRFNTKCYRLKSCYPHYLKEILAINYAYDSKKKKAICYVNDLNKNKCISNYDYLLINELDYTPNYFNKIEEYIPIDERRELLSVKEQKLTLLRPGKNCPNKHPRTVFLYYNETLNKNNYTYLKQYKIDNVTLTDKNYFVTYKLRVKSEKTPSIVGSLEFNGLIRSYQRLDNNLIMEFTNENDRDTLVKSLIKYQKFDVFPISNEISRKSSLYLNYKSKQIKFPKDFNYMPRTYVMPYDKEIVKKKFLNYTVNTKNLYIVKPNVSSRGRGIHLFDNYKDSVSDDVLISKYISNPHLINGKKYDIRLYVLVTGFSPLKIYVFNEGIARISSELFTLELSKLKNLYIHLTNTSINKKNINYKRVTDPTKDDGNDWTLTVLKKYIKKKSNIDFDTVILPKINDIIVKSLLTVLEKAHIKDRERYVKPGTLYQLFGYDILLDKNFRPWLLEVNYGPDMANIDDFDLILKSKVITDLYNIVGLVPFRKGEYNNIPYDEVYDYKNKIDEVIDDSICELDRPRGGFNLLFPLKDNIDYYSQFVPFANKINKKFWNKIKTMKNVN